MSMKPRDAVEFLQEVVEVESSNRSEGQDDLRFRYGEQWPTVIQNSRNLECRPCLTINEVDAYCRNVENQQRQQRPRIKVHAVDNVADPKIAKVISGIVRHIEVNSDADNAFDTAFSYAATIGWGYFRLKTDFVNERTFDQDIFFEHVENPFTVYFDPNSNQPDGSDAQKCLITDLMRKDVFEKMYPSAKGQTFNERAVGDDTAEWVTKKDVRVAEFFYTERKATKLVMLSDKSLMWADQVPSEELLTMAGLSVVGDRPSFKTQIKWCKTTSFEILEERDIPGRYIPVIPVYGTSYINNGVRIRFGLVRFAKDPQRMVNFWQTATTESIALAPKAKWTMAAGQDEGFENEWAQANVSAKAILHHRQVDDEGRPAPAPQRVSPEPPPAGAIQASMMASQNLQRVLGVYDPGVTQSRMHKSAQTINAEDQQTDTSNFHYYDNLTRSLKHAGRIILGWIPYVYDTQRVMRIIGEDGRPEQVTVNEKQRGEDGAIQSVLNDLTVGTYDVVMDTGPGYNSKRQESVAVFTQMLGTPLGEKIAAVADDVVIRQMDVPGADVIADRLAAANPLSQIDEKSDVPPQAQMTIKNLQAKLEAAGQQIQEMGMELKYRHGIEAMRQEGADNRARISASASLQGEQTRAATYAHDVETRALTAQNVAEINGMVQLMVKHIGTADLERELAARNAEQMVKGAEVVSPTQVQ